MKTLVAVVAVLAAALGSGCGAAKDAKPRVKEDERLPRLETVLPKFHEKFRVERAYTATVEAFEKTDLYAQIKGQVKPIANEIDIGRTVKKDEPLVTLDIPDVVADRENKKALLEQSRNQLELASASVQVAIAEVKEAEAQIARYQAETKFRGQQYARVAKLAQADTVAFQLAEESQLQMASAQAALEAAKAQIVTKRAKALASEKELAVAQSRVKVAAAELERLSALVAFATIKAPFDGVITKRWVDTGATIKDLSMPLVTVMRIDKVRVILDIPERDVPFIRGDDPADPKARGNPVVLDVPALADRTAGRKFVGTVTLKASALDPNTRTMRTEIHLDNKDRLLSSQMTGTVHLVLAERPAITVPSSALVRTGDRVEIYTIARLSGDPPRGVVEPTKVSLGVDDGARVEIRDSKFTGQERILTKGAGVIRPGDRAIAVPARPADSP